MTFPHWSRVTLYTSTRVFAECYVFVKQSHGPVYCASVAGGPLLPKLRGYFAEFLNEVSLARLGICHPPTCVGFGTDSDSIPRSFSREYGIAGFGGKPPHRRASASRGADLPAPRPARLDAPSIWPRRQPTADPIGKNSGRRHGNVDPSSIGYALRPRLRNRLTLGGRTCPRKPWNSGGRDFHPAFRYSCPHSRPHALHRTSRSGFGAHGALLYHSAKTAGPRLRHPVYSRSFSAQDLSTSQLLRTV